MVSHSWTALDLDQSNQKRKKNTTQGTLSQLLEINQSKEKPTKADKFKTDVAINSIPNPKVIQVIKKPAVN